MCMVETFCQQRDATITFQVCLSLRYISVIKVKETVRDSFYFLHVRVAACHSNRSLFNVKLSTELCCTVKSSEPTTLHLQTNFNCIPTYLSTRLCSATAGSSPPRRIAISVYGVHHVSMLHPSAVPGRLAISYVAFL